MPSSTERRGIDFFVQLYNSSFYPQIVECQTDTNQECPDAICMLEDGQRVGLEHTTPYYRKIADEPFPRDLSLVRKILSRKFQYDYRGEKIDQVWLLVQLGRNTLPINALQESLGDLVVPQRYDRVYLQLPISQPEGRSRLGLYELANQQLWYPDYARAV